nr:hypothetical protein Iba_chr14bCG8970 [Ipomoea batatas]
MAAESWSLMVKPWDPPKLQGGISHRVLRRRHGVPLPVVRCQNPHGQQARVMPRTRLGLRVRGLPANPVKRHHERLSVVLFYDSTIIATKSHGSNIASSGYESTNESNKILRGEQDNPSKDSPLFCSSIAMIISKSLKSDGLIGLEIEVIAIPRFLAVALILGSA